MKIIAIGGEPCSGKTTLVRSLIDQFKSQAKLFHPYGPVEVNHFSARGLMFWAGDKGMHFGIPDESVLVLGVYQDGVKFAGTDKLSMSVQPQVCAWLERLLTGSITNELLTYKVNPDHLTVIFEGDRLFNNKFLKSCTKLVGNKNTLALVLDVPSSSLAARRVKRQDTQTEAFVKGRRTKIKNILNQAPCPVLTLAHARLEDTVSAVRVIHEFIKSKSVEITREEATEALHTRAEDPFTHLVRRFKEEHDLDFQPLDFNDRKRFKFDYAGKAQENAVAFRVVYVGPHEC